MGEEEALGGVGAEAGRRCGPGRPFSTCSTMADIPSEWAMWMTVSTTRRLIPWLDSRPATNDPSILTVLMAWRLKGSNEDQLVPTSSTDSCTPMSLMACRSAAAVGSTTASSVTSMLSWSLGNPVWCERLGHRLDTSPRCSCSTVQFTPSWMLRDQLQASSQAAATIQRVSGPMSPLASAAGISRSGEIRPRVGMAPPHERLHAEEPARGDVDHGQVLQVGSPLQGERRLRVGQHATRALLDVLRRPRSGSVHQRPVLRPSIVLDRTELERPAPYRRRHPPAIPVASALTRAPRRP